MLIEHSKNSSRILPTSCVVYQAITHRNFRYSEIKRQGGVKSPVIVFSYFWTERFKNKRRVLIIAAEKNYSTLSKVNVENVQFPISISHSPFFVCPSPFPVLRSPFFLIHSHSPFPFFLLHFSNIRFDRLGLGGVVVLRSARNLNVLGSNPHPSAFEINLVFSSLSQKNIKI